MCDLNQIDLYIGRSLEPSKVSVYVMFSPEPWVWMCFPKFPILLYVLWHELHLKRVYLVCNFICRFKLLTRPLRIVWKQMGHSNGFSWKLKKIYQNRNFIAMLTEFSTHMLYIVSLKRIERLMSDQESLVCIICCPHKKCMILLPCHQQTCESCWSLWRMYCMDKAANKTFDENDDNVLKPTCPYCNLFVDTSFKDIN